MLINKKTILSRHFFWNKDYIIFFSFFIFCITLITCLFQLINLTDLSKPFFIGSYIDESEDIGLVSISKLGNLFLLSAPMFIIFSLVMILFINKFIINELSSGKIFYWIAAAQSRDKIIKTKIIFINILLLMFSLPFILVVTIFSAISNDSQTFFSKSFMTSLVFIINVFIFTNIYIAISIYLYDKKFVYNSSICVFLLICLLIHVSKLMFNLDNHSLFWKYISIDMFDLNLIKFGIFENDVILNIENIKINQLNYISENIYIYLLILFIQILILSAAMYLFYKKFYKLEIFI